MLWEDDFGKWIKQNTFSYSRKITEVCDSVLSFIALASIHLAFMIINVLDGTQPHMLIPLGVLAGIAVLFLLILLLLFRLNQNRQQFALLLIIHTLILWLLIPWIFMCLDAYRTGSHPNQYYGCSYVANVVYFFTLLSNLFNCCSLLRVTGFKSPAVELFQLPTFQFAGPLSLNCAMLSMHIGFFTITYTRSLKLFYIEQWEYYVSIFGTSLEIILLCLCCKAKWVWDYDLRKELTSTYQHITRIILFLLMVYALIIAICYPIYWVWYYASYFQATEFFYCSVTFNFVLWWLQLSNAVACWKLLWLLNIADEEKEKNEDSLLL